MNNTFVLCLFLWFISQLSPLRPLCVDGVNCVTLCRNIMFPTWMLVSIWMITLSDTHHKYTVRVCVLVHCLLMQNDCCDLKLSLEVSAVTSPWAADEWMNMGIGSPASVAPVPLKTAKVNVCSVLFPSHRGCQPKSASPTGHFYHWPKLPTGGKLLS